MTITQPTTETRTHEIDAAGKRLGVVATEAASVLLGKTAPDYARHRTAAVQVTITNAAQLDIPERKKGEIYQRYTGYPSGRRTETLEHLANRRGYAEVLTRTIAGMLPNNKLKKPRLKQLTITD